MRRTRRRPCNSRTRPRLSTVVHHALVACGCEFDLADNSDVESLGASPQVRNASKAPCLSLPRTLLRLTLPADRSLLERCGGPRE